MNKNDRNFERKQKGVGQLMINFQCSMCMRKYTIDEYLDLDFEWVDPKHKKKYGKRAICKCGAVFHKDRWAIATRKDLFTISTVHLETNCQSTSITDFSDDYFYETMIFKRNQLDNIKNLGEPLDFQMRYKTKEEAIRGHKDTVDKLEMIVLNPDKYPKGIIPMFCNMISAGHDQMKRLTSSEKEKLK